MYLEFEYDKRGRGNLLVCDDDGTVTDTYSARTGSINAAGELVNALPDATYEAITTPFKTNEPAMFIDGPIGWKLQMHLPLPSGGYKYRGFCIHPDGPKSNPGNGTKGCIGLSTDAWKLYNTLIKAFENQKTMEIQVSVGEEKEVYDGRDNSTSGV